MSRTQARAVVEDWLVVDRQDSDLPLAARRIRHVLETGGDIIAIEFEEQRIPWTVLRDFSHALQDALNAAEPDGHPAALILSNRPVGPAAMIGLLARGRCVSMITGVQPTLAVCADIAVLRPAVIVAPSEDWTPQLQAAAKDIGAAGIEISETAGRFGVALRPGLERATATDIPPPPKDCAIRVPTSGTTGPPKRIDRTWEWLGRYVRDVEGPIGKARGLIHAIPLATMGGVLTMARWATRPFILVLMPRLDVNRWADLVERHKPKFAGLPPAGLHALLEARVPKEKFASLSAIVTGSAPLDPALARALEDAYERPVLLTYGATEMGRVSEWPKGTTIEMRRAKAASSGKVADGVEVRIIDPETFTPLGANELGLIEVKNPEARMQPEGGWIRTTDLGRVDEDGYIYIEGRADDVIIRGGLKVQLLELDRVMAAHPSVARAAATGLPDPRLGQVPAALVVLKEGAPCLSEAEFLAWLKERIAPFKVPVRVRFVDEIPRTAMLKTNRKSLRPFFTDEPSAKPLVGHS